MTHQNTQQAHTQLPWKDKATGDYQEIQPVDNAFFTIAKVTGFDAREMKANAAFIVTATNSYYEMKAALETILEAAINGEKNPQYYMQEARYGLRTNGGGNG